MFWHHTKSRIELHSAKQNQKTHGVNLAAAVKHQSTLKFNVCGSPLTFDVWESVNIVLLKFSLVQQSFKASE